jgi:hypothetical protein
MTGTAAADAVVERAFQAVQAGSDPRSAVADIEVAAGGDRAAVEAARNEVSARVHARSDDFEATAALQLLNRTLSQMPIHDPLDWRVRWGQRFRRP